MPLRERQEVEEMSRPAGVTAAKLKPAAEQLCLCLQWVRLRKTHIEQFLTASPPKPVYFAPSRSAAPGHKQILRLRRPSPRRRPFAALGF
jgi:hypothetical protein